MMALPSSWYGACEGRFDSTRAYALYNAARKRNDPQVSTHDRVRALHGKIQDLVCARTLTQSSGEDPYRVPVSCGRVLNAFSDAMETFEALRSLPVNAPDRTDRRPCPPEE